MGRDPELQGLVDRARRDRERTDEHVREKPSVALAPARPRIRFGVYWQMHERARDMMLWWFAFAILGTLLFFIEHRAFTLAVGAFMAAFAIRIAVYLAVRLVAFRRFRAFPADLTVPFPSWTDLLDERLLGNPEQWQSSCELRVTLAPGADRAVFEAALDLFCASANGHYYTPESISGAGSDPRITWSRAELVVRGSLNVWVLGELYRLARRLDWIHRRAGGLAALAATRSGGTYGLSRPSYSGN
jgi:hypothetical protein